jgi:hypothetical protein
VLVGLGLLVLLVAAWVLWRVAGGHPRLPQPTRVLAPREWAFLAAAADALFPAGGAVTPSGSEAGIPAYTDRYVASVPATTRRLMRLLLFLVEHATLLFPAPPPWGRRRFSALSAEQRVAALEGWRTSRLFPRRLVFASLRALLTMGYFAHPRVLRELGLAPYAIATPVVEADLLYPRVGAHPDTIRFGRADLTPPGPARPLDLDGPLHPDVAEADA